MHLTPKYFFHSNKSLHLCETHCTFLPLFKLNLDFLQAVKVTKSGHHLVQDRASKECGSFPCLASRTSLHACLQDFLRCKSAFDVKRGIEPCFLLARSWDRWWLDFVTFTACKKSTFSLKRHSVFPAGRCKDLFKRKSILRLGLVHFKELKEGIMSKCYTEKNC